MCISHSDVFLAVVRYRTATSAATTGIEIMESRVEMQIPFETRVTSRLYSIQSIDTFPAIGQPERIVEILAMILTGQSLRSTVIQTGNCWEIPRKSRNGRSHTNIRRKKKKRNCLILSFPLEEQEESRRQRFLNRCACVELLFQEQHCIIRILLMIWISELEIQL